MKEVSTSLRAKRVTSICVGRTESARIHEIPEHDTLYCTFSKTKSARTCQRPIKVSAESFVCAPKVQTIAVLTLPSERASISFKPDIMDSLLMN